METRLQAVRRGLVLGKFLPYHAGHAHLIRTARSQVDVLTVLVCSIAREPIPGAIRFAWVAESHPDCRVVRVAEEGPQTPEEHPEFWPIWTDIVRRHAGAIDVVFTSEDYGDELARRLGARHVCVDLTRRTYPVSGTAIRRDPLRHWDSIPPVVRPSYVHRVAILGTESTGKTTLAQQLAKAFRTTWVPEYGRPYCEGRDPRDLTADDFDAISRVRSWRRIGGAVGPAACSSATRTCARRRPGARSSSERGPRGCRERPRVQYGRALPLDADVPWMNDGTRVLRDVPADTRTSSNASSARLINPLREFTGHSSSVFNRRPPWSIASCACRCDRASLDEARRTTWGQRAGAFGLTRRRRIALAKGALLDVTLTARDSCAARSYGLPTGVLPYPERPMKPSVMLTVASLVSLLLIMFHLTDDVLLQAEGAVKFPIPVVIFVVWLYGTLMLSDRTVGYIIMLLGGLVAAGMIVVHSKGGVVHKSGGFFFVWTMFALSATGWFTAILSARGLWLMRRSRRAGPPVN